MFALSLAMVAFSTPCLASDAQKEAQDLAAQLIVFNIELQRDLVCQHADAVTLCHSEYRAVVGRMEHVKYVARKQRFAPDFETSLKLQAEIDADFAAINKLLQELPQRYQRKH